MQHIWRAPLVLLAALALGSAPPPQPADLPYQGNWKIYLLQQNVNEVNYWLVQIDRAGKKVEIVSGIGPYQKTIVTDVKADGASLQLALNTPTRSGTEQLFLHVHPSKDHPAALLGAIRVGALFLPVRFEKTSAAQIDPKQSERRLAGFDALKAAVESKPEDRIPALQKVLKAFPGKPIGFLTGRLLLGELMKKKESADAIRPIAEAYLQTAAVYGREMQLQANAELARGLVHDDRTASLALHYAHRAAGLLHDEDTRGVRLGVLLALANALHTNGKKDEIKPVVERIARICDETIQKPRTPVEPLLGLQRLAVRLLESTAPAVKEIGLDYARQAKMLLKDDASAMDKLNTLKLLQGALLACGKADEAGKMTGPIEKLEIELDNVYLKEAIPFETEKFTGRKGKSDRAVLVELFTSAQARGCVPADIAFNALARTYSPREVVLLEYHLHIPDPDPLTCPASEARAKFYDVEGAPTLFIDGKATPPMGGARLHARTRYESLQELIDKAVEVNANAKIKLDVKRKGPLLSLSADVSELKEPGKAVKLRFVLAEETVRYLGPNRLRLHHHVVRDLPGGAAGFALTKPASTHAASVDLDALHKTLNDHLKSHAGNRPLGYGKLKIVALIQDDDSKKVLQAVQIDVPEANRKP